MHFNSDNVDNVTNAIAWQPDAASYSVVASIEPIFRPRTKKEFIRKKELLSYESIVTADYL